MLKLKNHEFCEVSFGAIINNTLVNCYEHRQITASPNIAIWHPILGCPSPINQKALIHMEYKLMGKNRG